MPAGEPPKTAAATGSSTGSYGLPASESTVRSARLPGVRVPISSSRPIARAASSRREAQRGVGVERVGALLAGPAHVHGGAQLLPRGRTTASTRASRCRAPRARLRRAGSASGAVPQPSSAFERGQCATGTSRRASSSISSSVEVDAVRAEKSGAEDVGERRDRAVAGRRDEHVGVHGHRPGARGEPFVLGRALGEMRPDRDPEREAPAVDARASRCTARAARCRCARARVSGDAASQLLEPRRGQLRVGAEDLEVDDRAQAELGCGRGRGAGEAVVGRRRDPGGERVGRAAPGDRHHLVVHERALAHDVHARASRRTRGRRRSRRTPRTRGASAR